MRTFRQMALVTMLTFSSTTYSEGEKKPIEWNGDFRFRHEMVTKEGSSPSFFQQERIRARITAKAKPNDQTQIEVRVASGPGRVSTNQTLGGSTTTGGNGLANYTLGLDRAQFTWTAFEFVKLSGGRIANPFFNVGETDLIWDADLNFDGLALGLQKELGTLTLLLNATHIWLDKNTATLSADVYLNDFQLGFKHKLTDDLNWGIAAALHAFNGMAGHAPFVSGGSGNSITGGVYTSGYRLIEVGAEFGLHLGERPLFTFFDYVTNQAATTDSAGFVVGAAYGKAKEPGQFSISYDYRQLQKDAAVGDFSDGDFFGGGTNGNGHKFSLAYMPLEAWTLVASYYKGSRGISAGETAVARDKVHLDLNYKF